MTRKQKKPAISIRSLTTEAEFSEAVELQKVVWRLPDYGDCVPTHLLRAVAESGGVILGAYAGKTLAGFLFVLAAYKPEIGIFHHSHVLGVLPEWTHGNLGFRLKTAHYRLAREQGIPLITWTYDPLLGANANLNVAKLGATVRVYKINYYGETMGGSELVSGIPSDRFLAEWWVGREDVEARLRREHPASLPVSEPVVANQVEPSGPFEKMTSFRIPADSSRFAVRIPGDFQAIVDTDKALALDWRLKTRELFLTCFEQGFVVVDFVSQIVNQSRQNFYILEQQTR